MRDFLRLYINGKPFRIIGKEAFQTLSDFLRYEQQATGTKVVCAEGDCGACTVLLGRIENRQIIYQPVNACIQSLYQLDCTHIITVEGLKSNGELNPVQESMVHNHAAQCGYCTPGFVVAMCALFDEKAQVSAEDLKDALTGNLCRCTGYEPIIKSGLEVESDRVVKLRELYPSQDILDDLGEYLKSPVRIATNDKLFFSPVDVPSAAQFKGEHAKTVIVQGATDVGVQCNKRGFDPKAVMSLAKVPGLTDLTIEDGMMKVGGRVTLSALEAFVREVVPEFYRILRLFGSPQIRYAGTLAGNIGNGSPIADTLPFLYVTDARIELTGLNGTRLVGIQSFYKGYKTTDMQPDEFITNILIPLPQAHETLKLYKVSKRKDLDISTFTAAVKMVVRDEQIESARIAYGGVAPVVLRLPRTEGFLEGKPVTQTTFEQAGELARQEISPISDVRGSSDFRFQLAENILLKFYYEAFSR